jgi:hypothetical protein
LQVKLTAISIWDWEELSSWFRPFPKNIWTPLGEGSGIEAGIGGGAVENSRRSLLGTGIGGLGIEEVIGGGAVENSPPCSCIFTILGTITTVTVSSSDSGVKDRFDSSFLFACFLPLRFLFSQKQISRNYLCFNESNSFF